MLYLYDASCSLPTSWSQKQTRVDILHTDPLYIHLQDTRVMHTSRHPPRSWCSNNSWDQHVTNVIGCRERHRRTKPIKPRTSARGPRACSTAVESFCVEKSDFATWKMFAYSGTTKRVDRPAAIGLVDSAVPALKLACIGRVMPRETKDAPLGGGHHEPFECYRYSNDCISQSDHVGVHSGHPSVGHGLTRVEESVMNCGTFAKRAIILIAHFHWAILEVTRLMS